MDETILMLLAGIIYGIFIFRSLSKDIFNKN